MKTLVTILFLNIILSAQWLEMNNGLPDNWETNSSIAASDENTAAIALYKYPQCHVFITTDAGENWNEIPTPAELVYIHINDIEIISPDKIWICTGESDPKRGRIYFTSNQGVSWVKQFENKDVTTYFNYIEMFDELNGMAMGDPPLGEDTKPAVFLRTINGGLTWDSMNATYFLGAFSGSRWQSVDFINLFTGYFIPSQTGVATEKVYKSTDSGVTWAETSFNNKVNSLKFYDADYGIALGQDNNITYTYRTTDGGVNWNQVSDDLSFTPIDMEYIPGDKNKMWLAGATELFYSNNGGSSWTDFTPSENFVGLDIEFVNDQVGWLLTNNSVFYTTTGSDPIVSVVDGEQPFPTEFSLRQNFPNPFNPETHLNFSLPVKQNVTLAIYDIIGNEIIELVNEVLPPGVHEYSFNAAKYGLSSGIYLYRLIAGETSIVKKMTYLK